MKVYRDSLLKMVHNPGGDWHPGWGVVPIYCHLFLVFVFLVPLKVSGPEIEQPQGDRLVDFFPQPPVEKKNTFDERLVTSRPQANSQGAEGHPESQQGYTPKN